jgi:F-type H+-transporting ATPase subunit epsilon
MEENKLMDVEIVTPQKVVYSGKSVSVTVPGTLGSFQVLYNHAPIVSSLDTGIVKIVDNTDKTFFFATTPGFAEAHNNKISVLVESADEASTIDAEEAKAELQKLLDELDKAKSREEKDQFKKLCEFQANKLKAVEKLKDAV